MYGILLKSMKIFCIINLNKQKFVFDTSITTFPVSKMCPHTLIKWCTKCQYFIEKILEAMLKES